MHLCDVVDALSNNLLDLGNWHHDVHPGFEGDLDAGLGLQT